MPMKAYHFISSKYALEALEKNRLKISLLNDLNDPFELYGANLSDLKHRSGFEQFKIQLSKRFGILCLSKSFDNPLLWSHYADRHRGVAIEIEADIDYFMPISYEPGKIYIDIKGKLDSGGLTAVDAQSILSTKFEQWKYENEVRIFCDLTEPPSEEGYHFYKFKDDVKPVRLILGALCKLSIDDIKRALPMGASIKVVKTQLAFDSYSVVLNRALPELEILSGN